MENEVDKYIKGFPTGIQKELEQIRTTIKQAAPKAIETFKYAMPTYVLNGNLVHFAAFKNHIGLYPTPSGIEAFREELSAYQGAKGTIRFPLLQPIPLDLVKRIVEFRVQENANKGSKKKAKRKEES